MLRRLIPVLLVVVLAVLTLPAAINPNKITNPSFETDTSGWTYSQTAGNGALTRLSSEGFHGSCLLKVIDSPGSNLQTAQAFFLFNGFKRNTQYTMRHWGRKVQGTTASFDIVHRVFLNSGAFTLCLSQTYEPTTTWALRELVGLSTDHADCESAGNQYRYQILFDDDMTTSQVEEWYFDDFMLCEGDCARTERAIYLGEGRWRNDEGEFSAWRFTPSSCARL